MIKLDPRAAILFAALLVLGNDLARAADAAPSEEKKPPEPGPWKHTLTAGLGLAQSSFSNNWAGSEQGAIAWVARLDTKSERQVSLKFNTTTELKLMYGQNSTQVPDPDHPGDKRWQSPVKSNDLILLDNMERLTLQGLVDPYFGFRVDSQFIDKSDPRGSHALSPTKFLETAGVARQFHKTEDAEFIARVGFGFRETLARAFTDLEATQTESNWTFDGGFEYQMSATQPMWSKRLVYTGKFLLFWPVFFDKEDELKAFDDAALAADPARESIADFWRSPDLNFQNTFVLQVTKVVSVNLFLQWIYDKFDTATQIPASTSPSIEEIATVDHGVRKGAQFKETLSVGITYKLF